MNRTFYEVDESEGEVMFEGSSGQNVEDVDDEKAKGTASPTIQEVI